MRLRTLFNRISHPKKHKAIKEFETMRNQAELRALSKVSLERPLDDREFNRMKELFEKEYGKVPK
jgi:hypothetical protein